VTLKGTIIMPEMAEEPARTGKVLAVGPGKREDGRVIPLTVKPGDKVLFPRYTGVIFDNVEFGGEFAGLRMMRESEIDLVLEAANGKK
jgi:chaperonin GroES